MASFEALQNFDLLTVGVAIAAIGILGFVVFVNNPRSTTNRTFLGFAVLTIVYGALNYANYQVGSPFLILWLLRLVIFSAVWYSLVLFRLFYVFPEESVNLPKSYRLALVPLVAFISVLNLTPLVFSGIGEQALVGQVSKTVVEPGIYAFVISVLGLVLGGLYVLFRKMRSAEGLKKTQYKMVFAGALITYSLILTFNMILPAIFLNVRFIPLAPVFILPFIVFTAYAIYRHHLLNVKVLATESLSFLLVVSTLLEVLFSKSIIETVFRISIFIILLAFSILLIRSVRREVEQRERLQTLSAELAAANEELKKLDAAKSEFISIASHQLRAPLTVIKGYVSMLLEGSLGAVSALTKDAMEKVEFSTNQLVKLIADLLDLSRIEGGRMHYEFKKILLDDIVTQVVSEIAPTAKAKGLTLPYINNSAAKKQVSADADKMREVVINLIDNAIKYTAAGRVSVELYPEKRDDREWLTLKVEDTGIGIKTEDIGKMFTKFGRTEEARRIRADGMGLGLYVAKKIVEDHGGRAWVESLGLGKGSTFFVQLPAIS